jgi:hypothetical protein
MSGKLCKCCPGRVHGNRSTIHGAFSRESQILGARQSFRVFEPSMKSLTALNSWSRATKEIDNAHFPLESTFLIAAFDIHRLHAPRQSQSRALPDCEAKLNIQLPSPSDVGSSGRFFIWQSANSAHLNLVMVFRDDEMRCLALCNQSSRRRGSRA